MMQLEIYSTSGQQFLPAYRGLRFDKVAEGGEDMALGFILDRSSSHDWPDVGYGYGVTLRNGLTPLWDGHMRHIEQDTETITVTALGNWTHLNDLTYIGGAPTPGTIGRLWSDTRYGKWKPVTNQLTGSTVYFPERGQFDIQSRVYIAPRKNERFGNAPWEYLAAYYQSLYDDIKRVTFNFDVALAANWVVRLVSYTAAWGAANVEWTRNVTGVGVIDVTFANARPNLVFDIEYNAANANFAGETGSTYIRITELKLYGTADITPTVTDVATDIAAQLTAGGLISADTSLIEVIALTLEPLFYESGESCFDALSDAASFGDAAYRRLAWGVESGSNRIFVRAPDWNSVRYVVPAECATNLSARGQTGEDFVTEGWGMYTDEEGVNRYTAKYYAHITNTGVVANVTGVGDDLASAVYGIQRDRVVNFGRVGAALATAFIQRYLIEHAHPQVASRWEVAGPVQDLMRGGAWIEAYEMECGWLVQVPHFRAVEAEGAVGVDLREWETTFMLAGLSYDGDRQTTRLIPGGAAMDIQRIVDFARRFWQTESEKDLAKRAQVLGM